MKYQTRIILYYTTIALFLSIIMGASIYFVNSRNTQKSRINSLNVTARQITTQFDDKLSGMDAIIDYILSDSKILKGITMLGTASDGTVPDDYIASAVSDIRTGLNTYYIIDNTFRTLFYNQNGNIVSSYPHESVYNVVTDKIDIDSVPYISLVAGKGGRSVLVGEHTDKWGRKVGPNVFSLIKEIQGHKMGFIETEKGIEELTEMTGEDDITDYFIVINGNELLYSSNKAVNDNNIESFIPAVNSKDVIHNDGFTIVGMNSDKYDFYVGVMQGEDVFRAERRAVFLTSVLSLIIVFLIGLIFIILWSYVLVKPINELRKIVEDTNLDNLNETPESGDMDGQSDEIRALAKSYSDMTNRLDKAVKNERRSSLLSLQAQFDTLQAQVNPHFLYNVLNIISARGVIDGDDVICEITEALASMLRYATNNKERYASCGQELEYLDNYSYLLKSRYEDKFEFSSKIDEGVRDEMIPKMTFQQIIENSVKHGFKDKTDIMRVSVTGCDCKDHFEIRIEDNGTGFTEEKIKELKQKCEKSRNKILSGEMPELEIGEMGLVNTYMRCFILYNDKLIFDFRNTEEGAMVVVGAFR
ncbi:MAG: histidine kinase [Lachnospiraceae bacterium]|nr:histidine kinase [Lachnospiraceae bacterium]